MRNTPGATPGGIHTPGGFNTGGAGSHGPTTGSQTPGGINAGGAATHGPTTGSQTPGGFNAGGAATHGLTTGSQTPGGFNAGGAATHGPTTGTHTPGGLNTGGAATHGPTSGPQTPGGFNAGGHNGGPNGPNGAGSHQANFNDGHPNTTHNPVIGTLPSRGSREHTLQNGNAIRTRPNGGVSDVHDTKRGMDIHHGLNGGRTVVVSRPDHSTVVYQKGRAGYVQRPYNFHGQNYDRRTYSYHGHSYDNFYRGYHYHGVDMHIYAPSRYYGRAYYGWASNPWLSPVRYHWGWMSHPWYGYYGYYFNPYPTYPSAAFWLTDYLISSSLQAAFTAHQEAGEVDGNASMGAAPLTPEVKQMIADEVRNQLALENEEAQQNAQQQVIDPGSTGIARMMNDVARGHAHVFVVSNALDVVDASGTECTLSDGDALSINSAPPPDSPTADVVVLASKGGQECPKGDNVSVALNDLQEMQNNMRANIDQGLQELKANQGKGGLPQAPASGEAAAAGYASVAPPADPNIADELQQEAQQAEQSQSEVVSEASQQSGGADTVPTISLGQSMAEVESILGQPTNKANLGNRVIYNYNGMMVTFVAGQVTNVQ